MRVVWFGVLAALTAIAGAAQPDSCFKIRMVEGRPVADGVYVNGNGPYRFLIDTGTTLNHLAPKVAKSIGLTPTFRTALSTAAGTEEVPGADGVEVAVYTIRAGGQRFLFAGAEALHQLAPGVQGVLGQAFLSRFDYWIDLRGKRMEFGKREVAAGEIRMPFQSVYGRPVVTTSLGPMVLDSGAHEVTLFGGRMAPTSGQMMTMTGPALIGSTPGTMFIGGRVVWHGDAIVLPGGAEPAAAGLMPMSLFRAVYVCNSGGYVSLD